jgi:hypothetical protein
VYHQGRVSWAKSGKAVLNRKKRQTRKEVRREELGGRSGRGVEGGGFRVEGGGFRGEGLGER